MSINNAIWSLHFSTSWHNEEENWYKIKRLKSTSVISMLTSVWPYIQLVICHHSIGNTTIVMSFLDQHFSTYLYIHHYIHIDLWQYITIISYLCIVLSWPVTTFWQKRISKLWTSIFTGLAAYACHTITETAASCANKYIIQVPKQNRTTLNLREKYQFQQSAERFQSARQILAQCVRFSLEIRHRSISHAIDNINYQGSSSYLCSCIQSHSTNKSK